MRENVSASNTKDVFDGCGAHRSHLLASTDCMYSMQRTSPDSSEDWLVEWLSANRFTIVSGEDTIRSCLLKQSRVTFGMLRS
ncbi:hypothetical protein RRG08_046897 [Elysia crispata]|uniref:Uncharacterized protein n=1 Tax=Elysia crispata TaxID=231223 RepID=A0AAE0ZI63_9GAST|nr:hypothetical protein RRG08_046897 [Elysia crispata]